MATSTDQQRSVERSERSRPDADADRAPDRGLWPWVGRIAGLVLAIGVYYGLQGASDLGEPGRVTASMLTLMAVYWMTEALPLPVTALLPLILAPTLGAFPTQPQVGEVVSVQGDSEGEAYAATVLTVDPGADRIQLAVGDGETSRTVEVSSGSVRRINVASPIARAAAPYANKFIFLYLAGFLIALGIERWGLHRRLALMTVSLVGASPARLVGGFMLATSGLSMWISNTATTVMMLPIALSVVGLLSDRLRDGVDPGSDDGRSLDPGSSTPSSTRDARNFAASLLLGIAYSASLGGMATLVGTPPNVFLAGFLEDRGEELSFARWFSMALPLSMVYATVSWWLLTRVVFPVRIGTIPGGTRVIREELEALGPIRRGEWTVLAVFLGTALLWIVRTPLTGWEALTSRVPAVGRLDDTIIGLLGALALFVIPVDLRRGRFALDWAVASRIPWGVLLLFGGGLSLASAISQSGLDAWLGRQVTSWGLPDDALPWAAMVVVQLLTELTSNLATTAAMVPIYHGVALDQGLPPEVILVPATLAASCAFMLPVATPPNAIVYGSRQVSIGQMMRAGLWLNLAGLILIPLAWISLGNWLLM